MMDIIAFDIEACNRYVPGSIFSVGIVESDIYFNIKKKYRILINPETKFVTKFRKPIEFNVNEKDIKKKPNFRQSYSKLNKLFSRNAIFIAHSISNDIRMLKLACERYSLPSFEFKFICSQTLYSIYTNTSNGIGLDSVGEILNIDFYHHQADEDALVALKLVQYICQKNMCNLNELIDKYGIKYGILKSKQVKLMKSELLIRQKRIRKLERLNQKEKKDK